MKLYKMKCGGPDVRIGRHTDAEINITRTEQSVSRFHAFITGDPSTGVFTLRDKSTFGTFMNGHGIREHELSDLDEVYFGASEDPAIFLRPYCCARPDYEDMMIYYTQTPVMAWEPRWVCLWKGILLIFENRDDPYPVHFVNLAKASVSPTSKPKNSWAVTAKRRTDYFATKKETEMKDWIAAISYGIKRASPNPLAERLVMYSNSASPKLPEHNEK